MTFPQNSNIWLIFHSQNQLSPKNINGPYGPYEHILQDILVQMWLQKSMFHRNWKMAGSKNPRREFWVNKKPLRGAPKSENGLSSSPP